MGNNSKEAEYAHNSVGLYAEYLHELEYMGGTGRQFFRAADLWDDILYYGSAKGDEAILDIQVLTELVLRTN